MTLVDTGFGLRDVRNPRSRLSTCFLALLGPEFREDMTAVRQVQRLGFSIGDVRHIVITHLDFDHAGGLDDFPGATVHMLANERFSAERQSTWLDRQRYRPQQWSSRPHWKGYELGSGTPWFGFEGAHQIEGVQEDVMLVPLIGHTQGHAGVAVREGAGWLLLAGDAYFHEDEMRREAPRCPPGLRLYQALMEKNRQARLANQDRLRALVRRSGAVSVVCSHDAAEFERSAGRGAGAPASMRPASTRHAAVFD